MRHRAARSSPSPGLSFAAFSDAAPSAQRPRGTGGLSGTNRRPTPAAIIQTRKYGVFARALATPIRPRDLVLGEGLCYLALIQSVLIVFVGAVMFDVSWGDLAAAVALVGMWALVGTGAGILSGTLFRTPEQAAAIGPAVGIAFAMLGGCMWPLEIVPDSVRLAGHAFPHAWAVDAWTNLLSRGGGLVEIGGYLGILAAYAVGLLAIASLRLRRSLVTP